MTDDSAAIEIDEVLEPGPMNGLDGLIDGGIGSDCGYLPPLWHWVYFLERPPQRELGPDGHPRRGRPTPPAPGMRRMFAGGRVTTWGQLAIGSPATLQSRVVSRTQKQGRSGPLWFMTVRNDYHQHGRLIIRDERDLVYRPPLPAEAKPGTRSQSDIGPWEVPAEPGGIDMAIDPTVLFRFSALTYNAHRIHYDPDWARAEGYGGLVVHGPLQALLLGERARRGGVDLVGRCFAYRLVAPFIAGALLRVRTCGTDEAAVFDPAGVMTAKASISDAGDPNT